MDMQVFIQKQALFHGLKPDMVAKLASCARAVTFEAGDFLLQTGKPANHLFLLVRGRVSIEATPADKGSIIIQTLADGDAVGWSWMLPPYTWNLDARALERVEAIALDAVQLRQWLDTDDAFAAKLYRRFSEVMLQRIHGMRKQLYEPG